MTLKWWILYSFRILFPHLSGYFKAYLANSSLPSWIFELDCVLNEAVAAGGDDKGCLCPEAVLNHHVCGHPAGVQGHLQQEKQQPRKQENSSLEHSQQSSFSSLTELLKYMRKFLQLKLLHQRPGPWFFSFPFLSSYLCWGKFRVYFINKGRINTEERSLTKRTQKAGAPHCDIK